MPSARYIPGRYFFLSLCLMLPAFSALSQSADHSTDSATTLWATPADLIQDKPATISPARAGSTDILSCPFETLRAAYLSLYDDTDALNVAALESEVFKVCIERQKQVKQLLDNEERLRAQVGDLVRPATIAQTQIIAPPSEPKDGQTTLNTTTITTLAPKPTIMTPAQPNTFRTAKSAELARTILSQCADRYTSGPIFGAATLDGGLHAFVYDAVRGTRLTVKAGDTLPGGLTVQRISIDDGVIVSEQDVERPLASTFTEPAFDDGGGLLFKTVTLADVYKIDSAEGSTSDSDWETLE